MSTQPAPETGPGASPARSSASCRRWTLIVVCLSTALLLVNVSAPNVALADISVDIGASFADLQWVLSGYALCLAVFQLTAGNLADLFGRRRLFLIGLGGFTLASALCAAAPSPALLILARALQGVAAAVIFPSSLALLAQEFEGRERTRAIGLWGATIGLSFALGPLAGGALVDLAGWRAIFAMTAVLGLPAIVLAAQRVGESRDPDPSPVDVPGVITLCGGLFLLVLAVLRGNALGWTSPAVLGALGLGALALAAFVAVERRARQPMLDLALFSNHTFSGASVVVALMAASSFGTFVYLALFLLVVRGGTPVEVGLQLAPLAVASFSVSILAPRLARRVPLSALLSIGLVLCATGLLAMRGLDADSSWTHLVLGLAISGAGVGLTNPLVTLAHLGVVPQSHSGLASGVNNTSRQLGVALGIALLGALLQARVATGLGDSGSLGGAGAARAAVTARLEEGDLPGGLAAAPAGARAALERAYETAFTSALNEVLLIGAGLALAGAVAAALLVRTRDFQAVARSPEPVAA